MERIGHIARGFEEARKYDLEQQAAMTPDERRRVAKALRDRVYGTKCPDVRDAVAGLRRRRHKDLDDIEHLAPAAPRKRAARPR